MIELGREREQAVLDVDDISSIQAKIETHIKFTQEIMIPNVNVPFRIKQVTIRNDGIAIKSHRALGDEILFSRIESIILLNYLQLPTLVSTYCITSSYL